MMANKVGNDDGGGVATAMKTGKDTLAHTWHKMVSSFDSGPYWRRVCVCVFVWIYSML